MNESESHVSNGLFAPEEDGWQADAASDDHDAEAADVDDQPDDPENDDIV